MANFAPADDHHAGSRHESPDERALLAARDAAVVCDLTPLSVLALAGADAAAFLQGQLSCDVTAITPGTCRFGSFNSPKGRMLANFVLWRDAALGDGFAMLLPGDICESVAKRLRMYVLRSKVTVTDVSAATQRMGVGGPSAAAALRAAVGAVPGRLEVQQADSATVLGLPGPRYVLLAPAPQAPSLRARLGTQATPAGFDVWRWLTIHAGVPVITAATQDAFVAQAANWDVLGGIDFQKGCYTGQEIIARTQYLGRLKERTLAFHADTRDVSPGDRIFSSAFEGQPCGTVVNAAPSPGGGCDLLAVLQSAAAERGDARLRASDGPQLVALPLPYAIPAAKAPRGT
ncbi:MAG: folate-binding protein [Casimicrobiaceae bacterium]